jgi:hypothetical protein
MHKVGVYSPSLDKIITIKDIWGKTNRESLPELKLSSVIQFKFLAAK